MKRETLTEAYFIGKEVLITGGTGTLGKELFKKLSQYKLKGLRIFSRDEFKQWKMKSESSAPPFPVGYYLGDVRNIDRVRQVLKGVDIVIHTAAMKQVPACENDPTEAVLTNIIGTQNVCQAAIENKVEQVMGISTDKAVYPVNLYGATKATAEKLIIYYNIYSPGGTSFNICRYGNVIGSRGSVVQLFEEQIKNGEPLTITSKDMTRFWITVDFMAEFILNSIALEEKNCIFVPRMKGSPLMKIVEMLQKKYPHITVQEIGIRKGEKLHECLITDEESVQTLIGKYSYIIITDERVKSESFTFTSENAEQLTIKELEEMVYGKEQNCI